MQGAQDRGPSRTYPRRRDAPHVGQVDVRLERKLLLRETPLFTEATDVPRMARSSPARAMQVRQVQTWIGDRRHRLHQSWQAKAPHHLLGTVASPNSSARVPRESIVHVLANACCSQRILEAMPERVEHAGSVRDA
jgi:hypothetical protein